MPRRRRWGKGLHMDIPRGFFLASRDDRRCAGAARGRIGVARRRGTRNSGSMAGALAEASGRRPGRGVWTRSRPPGGPGGGAPAEGTAAGGTTKRLQDPHLSKDSPGKAYKAPGGWQVHLPRMESCCSAVMPLHASGKSTSKPALPPGSSEGGGPGGGMKVTKGSAGTSMTPPGLAAGSEGRPVPSGDEDSTAAACVGAAPPGGAPGSRAAPADTEVGSTPAPPTAAQGMEGSAGPTGAAESGAASVAEGPEPGARPPGGTAECREGPPL